MSEVPEDERDRLVAQLLEEDEEVRYQAARELTRLYPQSLEQVILWTQDSRPRMREMACYILRLTRVDDPKDIFRMLYPEGSTLLVALLEDPEEGVRASAAAALGFHTNTATIPALLRLVSDPSEEVRFNIAVALGSFTSWEGEESRCQSEVEAALLHLMDDEDEEVRDWATFGIHQGRHNTPAAQARLWKALDDSNPDVRGEAAEGLALFGERSFLPRLETLLREDKELSPCYFSAAEILGDPALLPAVLAAAERWQVEEGETHSYIRISD